MLWCVLLKNFCSGICNVRIVLMGSYLFDNGRSQRWTMWILWFPSGKGTSFGFHSSTGSDFHRPKLPVADIWFDYLAVHVNKMVGSIVYPTTMLGWLRIAGSFPKVSFDLKSARITFSFFLWNPKCFFPGPNFNYVVHDLRLNVSNAQCRWRLERNRKQNNSGIYNPVQ